MATQKKPDLISRFYAEQRRDYYAREGLKLAEAGKVREAKAAQKQAEHWDKQAKKFC